MYHICHDTEIHTYQEELFDAFTKPELINQWWTVQCEGTPEVNKPYRFYFSQEFDWKAKVLECADLISITYLLTDADKDWTKTLLSFEIIPQDPQRQLLRFEHRNWSEVNDHFRKTSFCWALYLNDLKKMLEKKFHDLEKTN